MVVRATIAGGQGWSEGFEVSEVGWGCSRALLHLAWPLAGVVVGCGGPPSDFLVFPGFAPSAFVTVNGFPSSAPAPRVPAASTLMVWYLTLALLRPTGSFRLLLEARQHAIERGRYIPRNTLDAYGFQQPAKGIAATLVHVQIAVTRPVGQRRELGLQALQFDGQGGCTPDNAPLSLGGILKAAQIGDVELNHVAHPTSPGAATVASRHKQPLTIGYGRSL